MNKDIFSNYFFKRNSIMVVILFPCIIWISIGLWICYFTSAGVVEIIAILFPPFIVLLSYNFARRQMLLGGLLLLTEGVSLMFICVKFLSVTQNIIFQSLFVLPLIIASLRFLSPIRIAESPAYKQDFI